jgi:glyoxylase-like metal-dependent hydrolase (beta-lactamase superfamily II)
VIRTRAGFVVKLIQRRLALPLLAIALLFAASPESLRSFASIGADAPSAAASEHERAQARRRAAEASGAASAGSAMTDAGARAAFESAQRAKAVLDAGIAALGGLDALQASGGVTLVERGSSMQIGQSMTPDSAPGVVPYEESIWVDRRRGRMAVDSKVEYSFGPFLQFRILDGAQGYRVNHAGKTVRPMAASEHQVLHDRMLNVPQFVLLAALERAHTLRDVGDETIDGRPHRVISAVIASGADADLRTLAFDRATNLLTRVSAFYADPLFGDTTLDTLFTGYATRGAYKLPGGRLVRRAGQVATRVDYVTLEILADPVGLEARFAIPTGYATLPAEPPQPRNAVHTLAKDVYLIDHVDGTNQNVLFVAFDDYVLIVEAPEDRTYRRLGETVMRIIRETVPGKPIRYVAPTHHHSDHGIGVRPYIAEGVTIVTTPGNVAFVRDLASLKFELRPDALALKPRAPIVEVIDANCRALASPAPQKGAQRAEVRCEANKARIFRDASHIVELHDFGPESHVKEALAVWLPNERILFTGDVLETGYAETARWDGKGKLADILARYKWNVETIATAHSRTRKLADLRPSS